MISARWGEIERNARSVASAYKRKSWWASIDDLQQTAYEAQLDAVPRFNPDWGVPFSAFTRRAAVLACRKALLAASAPVSARHDPGQLKGLFATSLTRRVQGDDGSVFFDELRDEQLRPVDDLLHAAQTRARIHARLLTLFGQDGLEFALWALAGEFKPSDVVREHGGNVQEVYRVARRMRDRISRDPELHEIWRNDL